MISTTISFLRRAVVVIPLFVIVACSDPIPVEQLTTPKPQSGIALDFSDSPMGRRLPDNVASQVEPRVTISYSGQSINAQVSRVSGSLWNVSFDIPPGVGYTLELRWFWNDLEVARVSRSLGPATTDVVEELAILDSDYDTTFNFDNDPSSNYQELVDGTDPEDGDSFLDGPEPVVPARISFSTDVYSMNEGESLTIPVVRRDNTSGVSTVRVTIEAGDAALTSDVIRGGGRPPDDFNAVFEFSQGVSQNDNLVVQAVDDDLVENDESFFITLSNFGQAIGGDFTRAQVFIISDDDGPGPPPIEPCVVAGSGSDPGFDGTSTFDWSDNCTLRVGGLFEHSGYTLGVQNILFCLGFSGTELDGIFGFGTDFAVFDYQISRGLVADGIVGGQTWAQLQSELILDAEDESFLTYRLPEQVLTDGGTCATSPTFDWSIGNNRWELLGVDDFSLSEWSSFSIDIPFYVYFN